MHTITVTEGPVCIAHQLHLPYVSKCNDLHGHNYTVEVVLTGDSLNPVGMLMDFVELKNAIKKYDHAVLGIIKDMAGNTVFFQKHFPEVEPSTAENFALYLLRGLLAEAAKHKVAIQSVSVWETPSSKVTVTPCFQ